MKTKGPLFSNSAHGSMGGVITYSKRKTHNHARNKIQENKKLSGKQVEWRLIMDLVSLKWQSLSQEQKDSYSSLGKQNNPPITGFQHFAHLGMTKTTEYLDIAALYPLMWIQSSNVFKDYSTQSNTLGLYAPIAGSFMLKNFGTRKIKWRLEKLKEQVQLTINSNVDLDVTYDNFSVSFLLNLVSYVGEETIYSNFPDTAPYPGIRLVLGDKQIGVNIGQEGASATKWFDAMDIEYNSFCYYTISFESEKMTLYKNGKIFGEIVLTSFDPNGDTQTRFFSPTAGDPVTQLYLSNFLILKRSLTATEALFMYNTLKLTEKY